MTILAALGTITIAALAGYAIYAFAPRLLTLLRRRNRFTDEMARPSGDVPNVPHLPQPPGT